MFKDNQSVEGKVVIVTGASRGIGEATVKLLSAAGAQVVGCSLLDRADHYSRRRSRQCDAASTGPVLKRHALG